MRKQLLFFSTLALGLNSFGQVQQLPSDHPSFINQGESAPASKENFDLGAPKTLSISNNGVPCDGGIDTLVASGGCGYFWSTDSLMSNIISSNDTLITGNLVNDTSFYVGTVEVALDSVAPLPNHGSSFSGNVRGYYFTSPVDMVITGLYVPTDANSGNQNVAIVLFDNQTPPPLYSSTTNAFTTLGYWPSHPASDTIDVCFPISAGDVVGIYGSRNDVNSYAGAPYTSMIDGIPTTFTRTGMQMPLSSNPIQNVFSESGGSISRVHMFYDVTPDTTVTQVDVLVPQSYAGMINTSICTGDSILAGGAYQTAAGMYYDSLYTFMGCDSIITTNLTVNTLPSVSLSGDTLCTQDGVVGLNGTPAGGIYSGTGVTGSSFDPGTGAGNYVIDYAVTDSNGCYNSTSATFIVLDCASVGEYTLDGVRVYPNPVESDLFVLIPSELEVKEAKLLDVNGKLISITSIFTGMNRIDVSRVSNGVYFLELHTSTDKAIYKFIKK